jgi:hypothetical protein
MQIDKNREAEKKNKHKGPGRYPASCTNRCSGCGFDFGGNVRPAQIAVHVCKRGK